MPLQLAPTSQHDESSAALSPDRTQPGRYGYLLTPSEVLHDDFITEILQSVSKLV